MYDTKVSVAWDDSLLTGDEQIDIQHKKLFGLVSDLINCGADEIGPDKIQETLEYLANYTVWHFHFEEDLQIKYSYSDYERHVRLHEAFKAAVNDLIARYRENGSSSGLFGDVNRIVVQWFINHIKKEDKKIIEFIRQLT